MRCEFQLLRYALPQEMYHRCRGRIEFSWCSGLHCNTVSNKMNMVCRIGNIHICIRFRLYIALGPLNEIRRPKTS